MLAIPAVEELLRYDSPVQVLSGCLRSDDLTIAGFDLSDGQRVLAMLGAANRDAAVFSDPDRLILDRAQQAPLSFGGGSTTAWARRSPGWRRRSPCPRCWPGSRGWRWLYEPVSRETAAVHARASLPITAR